jgi:hypothetical protein
MSQANLGKMLPAGTAIGHLAAILSARLTTRIRKRYAHLFEGFFLAYR